MMTMEEFMKELAPTVWPVGKRIGKFGLLIHEGALCELKIAMGRCLLKILSSSHITATWCIMVNVSMWCLPTTAHKE